VFVAKRAPCGCHTKTHKLFFFFFFVLPWLCGQGAGYPALVIGERHRWLRGRVRRRTDGDVVGVEWAGSRCYRIATKLPIRVLFLNKKSLYFRLPRLVAHLI
jgi:hypothetical protein